MNKLFGGLRRPPINNNAHTNQPKTGAIMEKRRERRRDRWGAGGGAGGYIHRFGGERVGSVKKNKIKLSSLQIIFSRPANKFE
jgi:hypothetical protein